MIVCLNTALLYNGNHILALGIKAETAASDAARGWAQWLMCFSSCSFASSAMAKTKYHFVNSVTCISRSNPSYVNIVSQVQPMVCPVLAHNKLASTPARLQECTQTRRQGGIGHRSHRLCRMGRSRTVMLTCPSLYPGKRSSRPLLFAPILHACVTLAQFVSTSASHCTSYCAL